MEAMDRRHPSKPAHGLQSMGICTRCLRRWVDRETTRCKLCNDRLSKSQPARLRRNYAKDVAAGVCVRCHKRKAQPTDKRCRQCQKRHQEVKRQMRAKRQAR
jgi:hypothetical protein